MVCLWECQILNMFAVLRILVIMKHGVLIGVSYFENVCDVYNIGTDKTW